MSTTATDVTGSIPVPEPDLTPAELIARCEALVPMLRAQQDDAEERGFHGQEVQDALLATGVFRTTQPRRFGGYEFDLTTFLRCMVAIASGDPGTGWCVQLGASHAWLVASHFPLEVQAAVFGPDGDFRCPHPAQPTGEAVRVDGGYRLTGRWPYASGIPYANWALAGALVPGEPPTPVACLIPRSDLTMLDDWGAGRMLGLNSSGSNTFVVDGAFVPDERVVTMERFFNPEIPTIGTELYDNPLYVGRPAGPYHTSLVTPIVGAARAALDEFRDIIMVKSTSFQPQVPRYQFHEDQRAYGLAQAKSDAAEAILLHFADEYTARGRRAIDDGERIPVTQDARDWALVQQAGGLAADAVEILAHRSTSSNTGRGTRLGRYLRDVTTYRQHISSQQGDFAVRNAAMYLGASDRWTF
jgi:3-hydroxy-9,10-secoandrosta-1,3,5(10)-triene-9,17-dione monooxygenase